MAGRTFCTEDQTKLYVADVWVISLSHAFVPRRKSCQTAYIYQLTFVIHTNFPSYKGRYTGEQIWVEDGKIEKKRLNST